MRGKSERGNTDTAAGGPRIITRRARRRSSTTRAGKWRRTRRRAAAGSSKSVPSTAALASALTAAGGAPSPLPPPPTPFSAPRRRPYRMFRSPVSVVCAARLHSIAPTTLCPPALVPAARSRTHLPATVPLLALRARRLLHLLPKNNHKPQQMPEFGRIQCQEICVTRRTKTVS